MPVMDTSRLSVPAAVLSKDLRRALRMARDLGVQGIELDARHALEPELMTQTGLRQIRKWLGDAGVVVSAIAFRTRGGYGDPERLEGRIAATKAAHSCGVAKFVTRMQAISLLNSHCSDSAVRGCSAWSRQSLDAMVFSYPIAAWNAGRDMILAYHSATRWRVSIMLASPTCASR